MPKPVKKLTAKQREDAIKAICSNGLVKNEERKLLAQMSDDSLLLLYNASEEDPSEDEEEEEDEESTAEIAAPAKNSESCSAEKPCKCQAPKVENSTPASTKNEPSSKEVSLEEYLKQDGLPEAVKSFISNSLKQQEIERNNLIQNLLAPYASNKSLFDEMLKTYNSLSIEQLKVFEKTLPVKETAPKGNDYSAFGYGFTNGQQSMTSIANSQPLTIPRMTFSNQRGGK